MLKVSETLDGDATSAYTHCTLWMKAEITSFDFFTISLVVYGSVNRI